MSLDSSDRLETEGESLESALRPSRWRTAKVMACWSLALLVGSAATALAQGPQQLSLDDCIRIALEKNERVASASWGVRAAEQHRREVHAGRLPNANLRAGASFAPLEGLDPALTEGGEYLALVDVRQMVYDGGATRLAGRQADVGVEQATSETAHTAAELRLDTRLAYIDLLGLQHQEGFLQRSIEDLESYLGSVRSMANGGAVPKTDMMKVEIQVQAEQIALDDLRISLANARRHLLDTLGLPLDDAVAIQDTVSLPPLPAQFQEPSSPELRTAELGIHAAELDVRAAQAERRPTLALVGSVGAWTTRTQLLNEDSPHVAGFLAGVELGMPVWNGGATGARIEQHRAALRARRADYSVLRRQLGAAYRAEITQHDNALHKLELLVENRHRAFEQYELIRAQYAGGGSSSLEVLDAHRSLVEIALQQQEARADADRLHSQLLRLAGE